MEVAAERIESLKAGIVAAIAFAFAYGLAMLVNILILVVRFENLARLSPVFGVDFTARVAIALLSGFLFGVTYRYIIRGDRNTHLKDGAVLAFGLVRGSSALEISAHLSQNMGLLGVLAVESLLCFAVARYTLDFLLKHGWIKPFQ